MTTRILYVSGTMEVLKETRVAFMELEWELTSRRTFILLSVVKRGTDEAETEILARVDGEKKVMEGKADGGQDARHLNE